jgi:hypothetical protein
MSVFVEHMRWVTRIAAPILLAYVGDHRFGVFGLDLKSGNERVFSIHSDVVRFPVQFKPNGKLHLYASRAESLGQTFIDVQPEQYGKTPGPKRGLIGPGVDPNRPSDKSLEL